MTDAIPTPYDIAPLASSPFAPSALAWSMLFGILVSMVVLMIRFSKKPRTPHVELKARTISILRALDAALLGSEAAQAVAQASLALKRFIAMSSTLDLDTLTPDEIIALSGGNFAAQTRELLGLVATLERQKFSPLLSIDDARLCLKRALELVSMSVPS